MFINKKNIVKLGLLIGLVLMLASCLPPTPPPICTTDFLIWSINQANNNGPGADSINLDPGCVYQLGVVDNTFDDDCAGDGRGGVVAVDRIVHIWPLIYTTDILIRSPN